MDSIDLKAPPAAPFPFEIRVSFGHAGPTLHVTGPDPAAGAHRTGGY